MAQLHLEQVPSTAADILLSFQLFKAYRCWIFSQFLHFLKIISFGFKRQESKTHPGNNACKDYFNKGPVHDEEMSHRHLRVEDPPPHPCSISKWDSSELMGVTGKGLRASGLPGIHNIIATVIILYATIICIFSFASKLLLYVCGLKHLKHYEEKL